jgi:hypothetical protein
MGLVEDVEWVRKSYEREFFVDTNGKVIKITDFIPDFNNGLDVVSIHYAIASRLFPSAEYPTDTALKLGYIKVGGVGNGDFGANSQNEPTQSQLNTMDSLGWKYKGFDRFEYVFVKIR